MRCSLSVVPNVNHQGSMITDEKFGISDDLFIDQCSLIFGRSGGANTYQFVIPNPLNAVEPWGLEAALKSYPKPGK